MNYTRTVALALASVLLPHPSRISAQTTSATSVLTRQIAPSRVDATTTRVDDPHYIAFDTVTARSDAPLVLFMAGTGGKPREMPFFGQLLHAGNRIISISYSTKEAIQQVCPRHPDTECASKVRRKRIYGENTIDVIDDAVNETIVPRLVKLLGYLDRTYPAEQWSLYLANGDVNWSRVVVTGQSQGAGMAAYIAKDHLVQRAVLFSSPWDSYGANSTLAPWLSHKSVTPMDRWFAGYHGKENTAALIARCYAALKIPSSNIRVWTAEPDPFTGPNPYHGVGVSRFNSADNIAFMFGLSH